MCFCVLCSNFKIKQPVYNEHAGSGLRYFLGVQLTQKHMKAKGIKT